MKKMTFRINRSVYAVPLKDIVYMENERRKIRLHLVNGEYVFYGTFREVLQQLDDQFLHCSRSFILNKDHIRAMRCGRYEIIMDNGRRIHLSKSCFQRSKHEFEGYLRKKQDYWKRRRKAATGGADESGNG